MEDRAAVTPQNPTYQTSQNLLNSIRSIIQDFHMVSLARQVAACESLLGEDQLIDIAILGQFKAGKSSFINSLLSKPVLPVGVVPVTTVITRLRYGPRERAVITFFDGSNVEIGIDTVGDYISEARNPANERNVETVDIELPSLEPYVGLRLVDTPGLGSVFKYNTATSEEWLPRVGAALVAISADRPLSESDLDLIRDLVTYTPRVVLLLTKADLLSGDQQREVVDFFKSTLKRELGRKLPVFMYSTIGETQTLRQFIDRFLMSLSSNRDAEHTAILRHKLRSLAGHVASYLEIALKTSQETDADRERLRKLILDEKVNYELVRQELFLLARENMLQTRSLISARLEAERPAFTERLLEQLRKDMPGWKGNLSKLTRRYEEWLQENLERELTQLSKAEHKHFFGTLKKAQLSISRSLELFRNMLDRNIEQVLGVRMREVEWKIEVNEPTQPDISFTKVFDISIDMLWFVIPMFIFRNTFERHFLKTLPSVARTQLSRLAYQWEVRINKAIEQMRDQALRYVADELSTVDALLSKVSGQTEEIRRTLDGLHEASGKL